MGIVRKVARVAGRVIGKAVLFFLACIGVLFTALLVFLSIVFPPELSPKAMEKDFKKNKRDIDLVTAYLVDIPHEYEYIRIDVDYDTKEVDVSTSAQEHIAIDDATVEKAIQNLYRKGYNPIGRHGNAIHFQRCTRLMDFGSGVVYSIDGSVPNQSQLVYLTEFAPMAEPNWYYYEEDFNEYKRRDREQKQQSEQQSGHDDIKVVWGSENRL